MADAPKHYVIYHPVVLIHGRPTLKESAHCATIDGPIGHTTREDAIAACIAHRDAVIADALPVVTAYAAKWRAVAEYVTRCDGVADTAEDVISLLSSTGVLRRKRRNDEDHDHGGSKRS